ncbi:MAG TPA: trehalose-phosphatase [Atribacterota bacterium]|nr:trehalose-phosphatase [Atribacterota bacterium]
MEEKLAFHTVIFDLDGVVTQTATIHARSWKIVFDDYLRLRAKRNGEPFQEFTYQDDYLTYVDGKPRYKGVQNFLASRNIHLPFGDPADPPDKETICGIGNKKNQLFDKLLQEEGAEVFESTIALIKDLKNNGIRVGVASSSKNCRAVLKSVQLEDLFETIVDGIVSQELNLKGKPEGDIFLTAAKNLGSFPEDSVVVEDATSGVEAGRNGEFGLVLGVARENNEKELAKYGADLVVSDLAEININLINDWFLRKPKSFFLCFDNLTQAPPIFRPEHLRGENIYLNPFYQRTGKSVIADNPKLTFFLDYDGTLTPIVASPELAILAPDMKRIVENLAEIHTVAIVSGRLREDVQNLVGIKGIFYAGSHGFDIEGPGGFKMIHKAAEKTIPLISAIIGQLKERLGHINGILIEEKKFSVAVHYRKVLNITDLQFIEKVVREMVQEHNELRILLGKKVFEILPNIDWDKGKAVKWIMNALNIPWQPTTVFYLGDDTTDEYAFRTVITRGTALIVSDDPEIISTADFQLQSTVEVKEFFEQVMEISKN